MKIRWGPGQECKHGFHACCVRWSDDLLPCSKPASQQSGGNGQRADRPNGENAERRGAEKSNHEPWILNQRTRQWHAQTYTVYNERASEGRERSHIPASLIETRHGDILLGRRGEFKIESNDRGQRCFTHKNNQQRDKPYGGNKWNISLSACPFIPLRNGFSSILWGPNLARLSTSLERGHQSYRRTGQLTADVMQASVWSLPLFLAAANRVH